MKSTEIREKFLKFFEKRRHKIIPSASLVPENDPSALFISAGMQPLVPYLLGEKHPLGTRLVDVQKCVRTTDIDDVGDATHATFFEMLGNWSLGDYFKEDAIKWSYELLISKEEGFGLDPERLYITVFEGDENAPADEESEKIWQSVGIPKNRIYRMGADKNWWQAGESGPCGPDSEMYYDVTGKLGDLTREQFMAADRKKEVVEIWNDVFMEYLKKDGKVIGKLPKKNVDTGAGLERLAMTLQGVDNIYETDLLKPIMEKVDRVSVFTNTDDYSRGRRIIADHMKASVFMIADGVVSSNTERGYVLRRLIRMAIRYTDALGIKEGELINVANAVIERYENIYPELELHAEKVRKEIGDEEKGFRKKIKEGLPLIGKVDPFILYTSHGIPFELTKSILYVSGKKLPDFDDFKSKMKKHQELSRAGSEKKFKGGLADTSDKVIQYHTATHLLHQALHDVLGEHVGQKGSNITAERLRFDFTHPKKMTPEEIAAAEQIVNEKIKAAMPVNKIVLPRAEAEKTGARHFFGEKYGDQVSIYYIGDSLDTAYSKEFCGGPHVKNTSELKGVFKITKEEAVSAGVRRIKAALV